jgi:hypothetical protein
VFHGRAWFRLLRAHAGVNLANTVFHSEVSFEDTTFEGPVTPPA